MRSVNWLNHHQKEMLFSNRLIKQEVQADIPGIRVLCPTCWTVRADSIKSILDNYSYLLELWDEWKQELVLRE